ncbi:MAG: GTPase [Saprospiraceae bacterium]|nr:GTPase [Saprospiraceae bacterium]
MSKSNIIILGAAGRDFHNFNTKYRDHDRYNVVAFTAAQIPDIDGRKYPAELAGKNYPDGIPIFTESELETLIEKHDVHAVVFSYSDVSYNHVMSLSSRVNAAGANFILLGPDATMIKSAKPVISVCATRTGVGKSQTSRAIIEVLMEAGLKVVAIRHPMPYGDLAKQRVQRYAELSDLEKHECTIEEMEEYEPHIVRGNVIYAGVDYADILRAAENDPDGCDVILWDGGNNDFSFYKSDLYITLADPLRAGHGLNYYPGEVNLRLADAIIINKVDTASLEATQLVTNTIHRINPDATIIDAASPVRLSDPSIIRDKKVLVVEDGPSLTHGGMKIGAGSVAAMKNGAREMIDPRPYLKGKLKETFEIYPEVGNILPAMGYSAQQLKDLESTINNTECDAVVIGTPIDLNRVIKIEKPSTRVFYDLQSIGYPNLEGVLKSFVNKHFN